LEGKVKGKMQKAKIQRKNQKSWFPSEEVVGWADLGVFFEKRLDKTAWSG
jgi:hypothetical protein